MGLALPSCPSRSISYTPGTPSDCSDWEGERWQLLYVWNIFRRVCYDSLCSDPIFARILGHICRSRSWVCTSCCLLWRWPRYEISWTVLLLIRNRKSKGKQGAFWLAPLTLWHGWIIPYLNKNNLESSNGMMTLRKGLDPFGNYSGSHPYPYITWFFLRPKFNSNNHLIKKIL